MSAGKGFLELGAHDREYLQHLLTVAARLKAGKLGGRPLAGRSLAMIFRKSSTRTRVSAEAGMTQLGGHAIMISERESQLGRGESVADTARVLSRYVDGILIRTFAQAEVEELARAASVPVINGLTDLLHPCQVMADLLTVAEEFGAGGAGGETGAGVGEIDFSALRIAWIGDGNNMANSWLNAAYRFGFDLRLACPEGYDPDPEILARAERLGVARLGRDPGEAAADAHVVTTDVWASMGQGGQREARLEAFAEFQVDEELMALACSKAIFLHCLPAHRGEEVSAEVIDGPRSRVFQEAENRLHIIKALLLELIEC